MMAQLIDRKQLKADMKTLLRTAQVSPRAMTALYLGIILALDLADTAAGGSMLYGGNLPGTFVSVLAGLIGMVLSAGFTLYCMAVRRGERAEFLTLFDGFSFVGKVIGLNIVIGVFTALWSMLFVIPGIIAAYRYRFALYNLYEDPAMGIMEALEMSKRQTMGYKTQLFLLDLSYFGWSLLAAAPAVVLEWCVSYQAVQAAFAAPTPAGIASLLTLAPVGWILLIDLWSLAVSLFYLAAYQCTELGYFETAKSTSGVGLGAKPPKPDSPWGSAGPDGLGGL